MRRASHRRFGGVPAGAGTPVPRRRRRCLRGPRMGRGECRAARGGPERSSSWAATAPAAISPRSSHCVRGMREAPRSPASCSTTPPRTTPKQRVRECPELRRWLRILPGRRERLPAGLRGPRGGRARPLPLARAREEPRRSSPRARRHRGLRSVDGQRGGLRRPAPRRRRVGRPMPTTRRWSTAS